jgi:putative tryptophan/tyrosine transport system substrate-binding protein
VIRRREFIAGLGSAAAWPVVARAQQSATPMVGFLNGGSPAGYAPYVAAFRQGLKETGYVEGQNVAIEFRWADGQYDRVPAIAAELVRRQVAVVVTNSPLAVKAATTTIPIVFTTPTDPVTTGIVTSLNRPGGNITGVTNFNVEVAPKRLEFAHELVPAATDIAVLVNPTAYETEIELRNLRDSAQILGVRLHVLRASTEGDFDTVFATLVQLRAGALVIANDPFFFSRSEQLGALTLRHRIPSIYQPGGFITAGGLMSYGGSTEDIYRTAGLYTGRILKGEKPADLPVQQATRVKLIINLKTAKALGLTFPLTLLGRADEVIE